LLVLNCDFPDDRYYDVENDVWFKPEGESGGRVGITTVLSFLAGKILKTKLKTVLKTVGVGQGLGTIESTTYFGAVRSPVAGTLSRMNFTLQDNPKLLNSSLYDAGWVAEYRSFDKNLLTRLYFGEKAKDKLEARIRELKVSCFKMLPDDSMYAIGSECSTTLTNMDELLAKRPAGNVVHLVTDDQSADVELIRWITRTKNELVEARKEGNLLHFIIRKSGS
jgi:glycine cleavage system H protein